MIDRILGQAAVESELQKKVDLVSQANVDPIYLVKLVFASYGQFIVLGILSLLCLGLILKSMNNQNTKSNFYKGIPLMGFLLFLLLSIVIFLSINQFGFRRILNFAILFSLLMIPTGICLFFYTDPKNKSFSRKDCIETAWSNDYLLLHNLFFYIQSLLFTNYQAGKSTGTKK